MWTFFLTAGLFAAVVFAELPNLDTLRWNSRVLLLFAPSTNDELLIKQRQLLESQSAELRDRDMKVFQITGNSASEEQLRDKFHVKTGSFAVVLIGKDGSKKLKHGEPSDPHEIFKLIDSMPMRKEEVRQRE